VVEPLGEFDSDPDGDITEIKLIDPEECKQYFDWGIIGDRTKVRALEIKSSYFTPTSFPHISPLSTLSHMVSTDYAGHLQEYRNTASQPTFSS